MCGRYILSIPLAELAKRFEAEAEQAFAPRYNAAPGQQLPVITNMEPSKINLYNWGLIPSWANAASLRSKTINARAETVAKKPTFREAFKSQRCLVLANGYYEWETKGKEKIPHKIALTSGAPFAMAGLWESWTDSETGEEIKSFSIITTEAVKRLEHIHDRMPAILPAAAERQWLDPEQTSEQLQELLKPYAQLSEHTVSKRVGNVAIDEPSLAEPYLYPQQLGLF